MYFLPPWSVNSGFVVGRDRTLIVDTGSNLLSAETIDGYARAASGSNDIQVLNTKKHLDLLGGNCLFKNREIPISGHRSIARDPSIREEYVAEFNGYTQNRIPKEHNEADVLLRWTVIVSGFLPNLEEGTPEGGVPALLAASPAIQIQAPPSGLFR